MSLPRPSRATRSSVVGESTTSPSRLASRSSPSLYPPPSRPVLLSNARDRRSWSAASSRDAPPPESPSSDSWRAPTPPVVRARTTSFPSRSRAYSASSKLASAESSRASTPTGGQSQQIKPPPSSTDHGTPSLDNTTLSKPPLKAPPSAFHFPFQAYPGNPDPGLSIPGLGYRSRRSSMESLHVASGSGSVSPFPSRSFARAPSPFDSHRASPEGGFWVDQDLQRPHAPFMTQSNGSQPSRNNNESPIPGSSAPSFRAAFLSPASRRSSVWFPPPHVTNAPSSAPTTLSYAASEALFKAARTSTLLTEKLTKQDKPWLNDPPDTRTRASRWITLLMIFIGAGLAGLICWTGYKAAGETMINPSQLCMVMEDNFDNFDVDNGGIWTRDVEMSGFGYVS
jgi:hypothetical protein